MTTADAFFAPQLYIQNGVKDIGFYKDAFDAIELRSWKNDDSSFHVSELSIKGAVFQVHEEKNEGALSSPLTIGRTTVLIGLFVSDVDAVTAKAVAAGASIVSEPQTYDYGYRQAQIKDPFGHVWLIESKV